MTVKTSELALESELRPFVRPGDFLDCYSVELRREGFSLAEIAQQLFLDMPGWVRFLLAVRDLGVMPFGLKTAANLPRDDRRRASVLPGEAINFFRVRSVSENEIILGEDDKHLDFRISISRDAASPQRISLATWVRTHNPLGRTYLRLIMRFHVLIVTTQLAALREELA